MRSLSWDWMYSFIIRLNPVTPTPTLLAYWASWLVATSRWKGFWMDRISS